MYIWKLYIYIILRDKHLIKLIIILTPKHFILRKILQNLCFMDKYTINKLVLNKSIKLTQTLTAFLIRPFFLSKV